MAEEQNARNSFTAWFLRIRSVAPWVAVTAFISFAIPHLLIERFEPNAFKWAIGAPRPPEWQFLWRNVSLLVLLLAAIVSFPRWRSLVPLALAIALIAYASY